jgi:hypothetical protein
MSAARCLEMFSGERAKKPKAAGEGARATRAKLLPNPQPPIVFRSRHQPTAHRILPNIFQLLLKALVRSQYVIKRLFLPYRPRSSQRPIQAVRGRPFNRLNNLNRTDQIAVRIAKRRQQKMRVVRHDHDRMNHCFCSVIMQAMPQHDIARRVRQPIETAAAKRDKQSPIVFLIVRKPPPILVLSLQGWLSQSASCICGAGALVRCL